MKHAAIEMDRPNMLFVPRSTFLELWSCPSHSDSGRLLTIFLRALVDGDRDRLDGHGVYVLRQRYYAAL